MPHVYPHPDLTKKNEYLPGIGIDGVELPKDEAEDLVARGLAVLTKPKIDKPADPAPEGDPA
jgi:hypothetical protein